METDEFNVPLFLAYVEQRFGNVASFVRKGAIQ
jgi:hypothetical protein